MRRGFFTSSPSTVMRAYPAKATKTKPAAARTPIGSAPGAEGPDSIERVANVSPELMTKAPSAIPTTITITAATRVERTIPRIFTSKAITMAPSATCVARCGQTYRPIVRAAAEADAVLPTMKTTPATTPTGRER